MKQIFRLLIAVIFFHSCKENIKCDLAIVDAKVLDVNSGKISEHKTVLILNGKIIDIVDANTSFEAKETIKANGKLLTPGFIDTHIHPTDVLGDYEDAPKELHKDSLAIFRKRLSDEYLPFGTTTVLTMGQPEKWVDPLLTWEKSDSNYVDFYLAGGAMISKDNRVPYIAHTEVTSPELARKKVIEYHNKGIKYVKLYTKLKEPEYSTVIKVADSIGMIKYVHAPTGDKSNQFINVSNAMDKGLRNFEHLFTPLESLITQKERDSLTLNYSKKYGELTSIPKVLMSYLDVCNFIEKQRQKELNELIQKMKLNQCNISTTLGFIYQQIEPTFFSKAPTENITEEERNYAKKNFDILMKYVLLIHQNGIPIRLGSDIKYGGNINLCEMMLFCQYGMPVMDAFKIATINGAKAMAIDNEVGTIEKGKKANLILWYKNPFDNYNNFIEEKIIIKNGVVMK